MEWLMLRALALSILPSVKSAGLEHKNQIFRFTSK